MTNPTTVFDPELTAATARRIAPAGPRVSPRQARAEVAGLRAAAERTFSQVLEITGLAPEDTTPGEVLVVDRAGWSTSATDSFRILSDLPEDLAEWLIASPGAAPRVTAVQLGSVLGFLSTRVLGQYDPFMDRLVLVAPNIYQVRTQIGVRAGAFRTWVCLHEQTHTLQFRAAPWLRDHLIDLVHRVLRDARDTQGRPDLSETTGLMSFLEGHANHVMDASRIRGVAQIRQKFATRSTPKISAVLGRMLGMDMKLAQYKHGQRFCDEVVAAIGMEGLNRVFTGPEFLPDEAEIHDPQAWIARTDDLL